MISKSERETMEFAREYAKTLSPGDVVLLEGEMGAGKTVFVKGLAEGLGVEDEITSPTYAYMNDYGGVLYHYDCYRLKSGAQAEALGRNGRKGRTNLSDFSPVKAFGPTRPPGSPPAQSRPPPG